MPNPRSQNFCFLLENLSSYIFVFRSATHSGYFVCIYSGEGENLFFSHIDISSAQFIERIIVSSLHCGKSGYSSCMVLFLNSLLCSIGLLILIIYCLNYCSFIRSLHILYFKFFDVVALQDYLGNFGLFAFLHKF